MESDSYLVATTGEWAEIAQPDYSGTNSTYFVIPISTEINQDLAIADQVNYGTARATLDSEDQFTSLPYRPNHATTTMPTISTSGSSHITPNDIYGLLYDNIRTQPNAIGMTQLDHSAAIFDSSATLGVALEQEMMYNCYVWSHILDNTDSLLYNNMLTQPNSVEMTQLDHSAVIFDSSANLGVAPEQEMMYNCYVWSPENRCYILGVCTKAPNHPANLHVLGYFPDYFVKRDLSPKAIDELSLKAQAYVAILQIFDDLRCFVVDKNDHYGIVSILALAGCNETAEGQRELWIQDIRAKKKVGAVKNIGRRESRICQVCVGKPFARNSILSRHFRDIHSDVSKVNCSHCGREISRRDSLERHNKTCRMRPF